MPSPPAGAYQALAADLVAGGLVADPWFDGRPRFRLEPVVLDGAAHRLLATAAEALAAAHDEAARLVAAEPALAARYLPLTPVQRLLWESSGGAWHGIARADAFFTDEGLRICELNSDTPSGQAEAVLLSARAAARTGLVDPNASLGRRLVALVEELAAARPRAARGPLTVGIVYPTEMVEDLSMIRLYQSWLEARGHRVVLGAPFNLGRAPGRRVTLFGAPLDVVLRHYKTDWWAERESPWDDEPPPADAAPLTGPLAVLLEAAAAGTVAVVNPFGAVVTQNKRTLALLWEERRRLSSAARNAVERWLPETVRLEALPDDAPRAEWVLKSDYGCEGAEVLLGSEASEAVWRDARAHARPGRWVAQRRFRPITDENGEVRNLGVYLVAGEAAGYLTRVHQGATDLRAATAATLLERGFDEGEVQ